ncbi:ATP-binding protein [Glycomyces rhizosphaerae]|uniref:histidine kinase n=1 Tax=Glycomyces rhizosphaerae TaxID=2054422 RepID=A0ABV7Q604_9ACTN
MRRWRHWTVRTRMAVTAVALCALALCIAIVSATALLEDVLTDRIDDQLHGAAEAAGQRVPSSDLPDDARDRDPNAGMPEVPRLYVYSADGELVSVVGDEEADLPALTGLGDLAARAAGATPYTVEDTDGNSWRVLVQAGDDGDYTVLALSAEHVAAATESLRLIGGAVSLSVLALLALSALWVVGIGLRPLDRMEATAARIAERRLDERVTDTDPHTETGRLGRALNTMLTRIQAALDDSAASEERLRRFLADASHELRTPLTSITGFAQLYRRGGAPPGPVLDEAIGRIEGESQRMRLLLDDLMLLAAIDEQRPSQRGPVDLLGICADVIGDAHLRERHRFVSLEPLSGVSEGLLDDVGIVGDEPRLRQVVTNLVANALRHTPPDARIAVRLGWSRTVGPPCLAQVGEVPAPPYAVVEVADTGPGIGAEHAESVFERLFRLDPSRARTAAADEGGTGLGLSIVAAIVANHGGCVRLCATPGGGATFRVLLPEKLTLLQAVFEPTRERCRVATDSIRSMRKPSPSLLVNSGLALLLAAGAGGAYLLIRGGEPSEAAADATATATVQTGTVTRTVSADGTVTAASTVTADFAASGTVTKIDVAVGDLVEKGQQLATVDATDARRELDLAEDNLDAAEDSLDRAETDAETETAEDAVDEAEAAVEEAEDAVADTVLTAPAAGTVIAVNGTIGQSSGGTGGQSQESTGTDSSSTTGFIQIADLGNLQVTAAVAEGDAASVLVGQSATVTWNAIDASAEAELAAIAPTAESSENVATYDATLTLVELPEQVRLGQTVSVSIVVEEAAEALYLPTAAVERQGDQGTVTLVGEDGTQTETTVTFGLEGDTSIEIASGLSEGDTVVMSADSSGAEEGGFEIPGGGFPGGGGGGFPGGGAGGMPGGGS